MYVKRSGSLHKIAEKLSLIENYVIFVNKLGHYDINRDFEYFFIFILNQVYNYNLVNMNDIQSNYPAIDLGDINSRVCIQVTSENTNSKYKATLEKFLENDLDRFYDKIVFLLISNKPKCSITSKNLKTEVIDMRDLFNDISKLSDEKIYSLEQYINENLCSHLQHKNVSILPIMHRGSINYQFDKLINFLQLENELTLKSELINEMKNLILLLNELSRNEREYLFFVMNNSKYFDGNSCLGIYIPSSQVDTQLGIETYPIFQNLEFKGILQVDNEFEFNNRPMTIVHSGIYNKTLDLDILGAVKSYCAEMNIPLKQVICNVDFSKF